MRTKLFVLMSLVIVASMLLGACQPKTQTTTPAQFKNSDTITFITGAGEPETLDPAWTYETAGSTVELNLYEGLTFFNRERTDEFIPALATEWSTSADGLTWTFNIRDGVKFHKGGMLEPHDVAYTVQRAMLQGRIDGWQWIVYESFFGPDFALASVKDFAVAYTEYITPEEPVVEETPEAEEMPDITEAEATETADGEVAETETPEVDASTAATETPAVEATEEPIEELTFEDLTAEQLLKVCEDVKSKVVADDAAGTVTYNFAQPVPWMLALTSQQFLGGVLDSEWMAENGDWDGSCETWTDFADPAAEDTILFQAANGTGPYMLDHYTSGEEIVLNANPDYWRTEPMWEGGPSGVARIPRVVIKNIPEWGTRLSMLQAGDADEIYTPPQYREQLMPFAKQVCGIDETSCADAEAGGYLKFFRNLPMPAITPAQLNWQINLEGGNPFVGSGELDGNGIPADFFSNEHVRKAFNYCFNFEAMVNDALAGDGVQAQGPIPQGMMGYREGETPLYAYDPAKCEEEFKAAMFADADGNEVSVFDKGFYMQLAYNTGNDTRRLAAEILKDGIEGVNPKFTVAVLAMPWPVMLESRRAGKLPIYVGGWVEDYHDPHNWVNPFLYSQGAYGRIVNMTDDKKAEYDGMILAGAAESDPAARTAIYEQIQLKSQEDAVNIWLYQQLEGYPFQPWINGFYFNPAYGNPEYGWIYSLEKVAP